ncbi:MAG TPA: sigma-54 dependent transcriptional regulator [Pirellulaceae bacterium]|nr:sigma-54 dependent transcriptional regulator [Pirellulaceae bacterium]
MPHLLIIDDEPAICWGLKKLGESLQLACATASSAEEGLQLAARQTPDVIILDVRLPGMDGIAAMEKLREHAPEAPIIVITAHGDLSTAVEAVHRGAFDYLAKPFDLEQVERVLQRALDWHNTRAEQARFAEQQPLTASDLRVDELVGRSPVMQEIFKRVALVSASDACVLLWGESGTGKELLARAIHRYSRRAQQPFVAVNVASLSSSLAESELFGHVRGAFTGADEAHPGLLAQANGGTLFLDEVADIPLPTQVKLLRALEHGEILPVGGTKPIQSNFRVVSATHQDLRQKVREGTFRHDLLYRLCAFQIDLPPLRSRGSDVRELAEFFTRTLRPEQAQRSFLAPNAIAEIERRTWPGNVRELRNAIEHALILARGEGIRAEHLPAEQAMDSGLSGAAARDDLALLAELIQHWTGNQFGAETNTTDLYEQFLALVEPPFLQAALNKHFGQCASAARVLGLHRTTLKKKLDQYKIEFEG